MRDEFFLTAIDPMDVQTPKRLMGCCVSGSSQKTQSAPVVNQPGLDMLNSNGQRAIGIANNPFQPYTGQFTAPLSQNQQTAVNSVGGLMFAGAPQRAAASNTAYGLTNYQAPTAGMNFAAPGQVSSVPTAAPGLAGPASLIDRSSIGNLSSGDVTGAIQKYMNPYTSDVINATQSDIERQREIQRVADSAQATQAGAWGGARQGVADANTNEAYGRIAASTIAGLRAQGFDTASGLAQTDAARALQAASANQGMDFSVAGANAGAQNAVGLFNAGNQQATNQFNTGNALQGMEFNAGNVQATNAANAAAANQTSQFNVGSDLASAGVRQTGATSLQNAGAAEQQAFGNYITGLMQTGQIDQTTAQNNLDALYAEFQRQVQYPYQGQQLINQSLGLVPASLGTQSKGSGSSFGLNLPISPISTGL